MKDIDRKVRDGLFLPPLMLTLITTDKCTAACRICCFKCIRQLLGKTFPDGRDQRPTYSPRPWAQTYHGLHGRGSSPQSHRTGLAERQQSPGSLAESHGQGSERPDIQAFFISLGARYKRIRKRPRGVPSPQLYAYKTEKLQ